MSSPFKFLDAYTVQDQDVFFGRDAEIDEMYQRIFKSNLLLVYGASGTGKTSLVQCGLPSNFSDENWFSVYIRRQQGINQSMFDAISDKAVTKVSSEELDPEEAEIVQRVEGLYLDHFKPVYLIFDQLEEIFILGSEAEQRRFYQNIKHLVTSKLDCKVILIIREEYMAYLSAMEMYLPSLFDNRIRIEKMRKRKAKEVIKKSCDSISKIAIQHEDEFLSMVVKNLSEDNLTVELTYLQVYLDKLFRESLIEDGVNIFNPELVEKIGEVTDVLDTFLDEQVLALEKPELGWGILQQFISREGTKKGGSLAEVIASIPGQTEEQEVRNIIAHFRRAQILTLVEHTSDQYEFTHDSLAKSTFDRLDAKDRNRLELGHLLDYHFKNFQERGILLSKENLQVITPYVDDLNIDSDEKDFIQKSRRRLYQRRRNRVVVMTVAVILLSISTTYAGWKAIENDKEAKELKRTKEELELAKDIVTNELNKNKKLTRSLESLKIQLQERLDSLNLARDSVILMANEYTEESEERKSLQANNYLDLADTYFKAQYYREAFAELNKINRLNPSPSDIAKVQRYKKEKTDHLKEIIEVLLREKDSSGVSNLLFLIEEYDPSDDAQQWLDKFKSQSRYERMVSPVKF